MGLDAPTFAAKWRQTCNTLDPDRVAALYSEGIIFKSPRVRTVAGEPTGTLHGRRAVRDYWHKIFQRRPDLAFIVGRTFAGVDSIALEYRVGDLQGIEFMILDGEGLIVFAAVNDLA